MLRGSHRILPVAVVFLALLPLTSAPPRRVVYLPFSDAKPILENLSEILPPPLHGADSNSLAKLWPAWVKKRDAEIRERLSRGDEDTVVNFLFFGTSFTKQPRITAAQIRALAAEAEAGEQGTTSVREIFSERTADLVRGMTAPGHNERLRFCRGVAERAGVHFSSENVFTKGRMYLVENVLRVLKEQSSFQQALAAARALDPTEEFAERSKLYKERGLSLDTSLLPDYALEVALRKMRDRGLLARDSIHRVGIIGPGLDFTDKQEGYDFYPPQTVQPFAVADSLLRLGLAMPGHLDVATLDLSARINEHIERAQRAAAAGRGYTIQLPRDAAAGWEPAAVAYWKRFGDQIGSPVQPVTVPAALKETTVRAVRVRPDMVRRLKAFDVNIVLQREDLPSEKKFDLLIATNIFVYYDTFEQSLALANVGAMLRPGGFLLTNNLLLELPSLKMKGSDYVSVPYSAREAHGDRILWYRRQP